MVQVLCCVVIKITGATTRTRVASLIASHDLRMGLYMWINIDNQMDNQRMKSLLSADLQDPTPTAPLVNCTM